MNGRVVAIVVSVLEVALYLASVVVTGIVTGAVSTAVEQLTATGTITGDAIAANILEVPPADALLGWILVDTVVVLLHLDDFFRNSGGPAPRSARSGIGGLILLVIAVQVGYLALTRWTGLDAGWLVIPHAGGQEFLTDVGLPVELVVLAVLVHPLAVEVFFRASIMRRLESAGLGVAPVILIPAVLFALVQPSWGLAAIGLLFGIAVGALYLRTRSLLSAVVAHILFLAAGVFSWLLVPAMGSGDLVPAVHVVLAVLATALALKMLWPRGMANPEPAGEGT